jgi:hypothetical protein
MRILSLTLLNTGDFERILHDASTPPPDRDDVERALRVLFHAYDPRDLLAPVPEHPHLLEFVITGSSSGHSFGMLFVDMGHAADAVAYWRDPPLLRDAQHPIPHGFSRAHALWLAASRLEDMR